jgi:excisionase family DNA binding protein
MSPYLSKTQRKAALSSLAEKRLHSHGSLDVPIPKPMSKSELAEFLDVSERFLETQVKEGRLRALKLSNRALRFMPRDVQKWLNSKGTIEAAKEVPS